jgi:hypothetical protein
MLADKRSRHKAGHSFILGGRQIMGAKDLNLVIGINNLYTIITQTLKTTLKLRGI